MTLDWLYKLSDWNPQFFREVKGRLKPRSFAITVASSLLLQLLLLLLFAGQLPSADVSVSRYCTGSMNYYEAYNCVRDSLGNPQVNWQLWWFDIFRALSWALSFVLLIAGVYMLIGDLGKEEKRGTLNFIRLSPQASSSFVVGKILGVPIVPYLAVAIAMPLHLWAALSGDVSPQAVLSIYLFTGVACCFYYTGALLFAFLGGFQGWVGAVVVWVTFSIFFQFMQVANYPDSSMLLGPKEYFGIPVGSNLMLSLVFAVITSAVGTYWMWQAVNRRFRNPNATLLSKQQSYQATVCFEIWLLGFVIGNPDRFVRPFEELSVLALINLAWFVLLIAALTPQRQTLLDWARYRRERVSHANRFWSRSIINDLLWGEKSPALVMIGLNLAITVAVFAPWILTWSTLSLQLQAFVALVFGASFVLICAAIVHMILFMKSPRRTLLAASTIGGLVTLPPAVLSMFSFYPPQVPIAWLFSAFAFAAVKYASIPTIFAGFLCHLGILSLLTLRITRQLRKAGESESKALLAGSRG